MKDKAENKLVQAAHTEGWKDFVEMLDANMCDSLAPAICTNVGCDYMEEELEHDYRNGHCPECETNTVDSIMELMLEC